MRKPPTTPWPKKQAVAILMDANRRGKKRLAAKAKASLKKPVKRRK